MVGPPYRPGLTPNDAVRDGNLEGIIYGAAKKGIFKSVDGFRTTCYSLYPLDGTTEVVGPDGPVPFIDLFQGRDELIVYKHMWYDGAPHQGQCEGCTTTAWNIKDAVYLNVRGVSFAVAKQSILR